MRSKEEISKDKSNIHKLILEVLIDIRDLLTEFEEEEPKCEIDDDLADVKCGVSEDEIATLFEENCK